LQLRLQELDAQALYYVCGVKRGRHHLREEEWQTVLRRVLALVAADQLKTFHALSEHLGGELWRESERARQARLRHEALEAVRAAVEHLGLPEGQAPTIPDFKRAAREAKLPMTFGAVYSAFEERWDLVTRYYLGERIPETAAQRGMRRSYLGRREGVREAPLTGLRLFLDQKPRLRATRREDYEAWAQEFNESPPSGYGRVSENSGHISSMLAVGWDLVLEVAGGRKELKQAQREALSSALSEAGPLVGHRLASQMLGLSPHARHAKQPDYPQPVVRLGQTNSLWLRSDIEGYAAGRRDFTHEPGALQDQYLDGHQLGKLLGGISGNAVTSRVQHELWDRVPRQAGKAGKHYYWSHAEVERWLREAPRQLGPMPGPRRKAVSEVSVTPKTSD
jgi:predicted DNA-binding transcriptional regulator AlpA